MFTVIYCLQQRSSCYLVADAIKAQISKSYYHVYHMPGPLELFKGSLEFANGKFWGNYKHRMFGLIGFCINPQTNTLIYIFMEPRGKVELVRVRAL